MPKGWEWCIVDDFAYVASGSTPSKDSFVEEGVPYIKMYNLRNQKIDFDFHPQYVKREVHEGKLQRSKTEVGDLIMNIVGPPLGKLAIIPPSLPESNFNQAAVLIRPYLYKDVLVKYLFYYLSEMSEINSISTKGTAGQVNISLTQSQNMRIALPPYEEQKRIIKTVENLFQTVDIIDKGSVDITISIGKVKSKILDLAIHGKLVPQDPNDEPAIELLKRINPKFTACDNAHVANQLPNSWCWTTVGSIFQHNTGKALNKSDSHEGLLKPYLTTSNVYWNCFDFTEVKEMYFKDSELEKCTISKGDLLVCEGGDIGRAAIWNYDYDICIQNHIHRLRAKGQVSQILYLYVLMLYKWTDKIHGKGIGLQGLSSGLLDKLVVPLPPYNEQLRIVAKIEELFAVLDEIQKSIEA